MCLPVYVCLHIYVCVSCVSMCMCIEHCMFVCRSDIYRLSKLEGTSIIYSPSPSFIHFTNIGYFSWASTRGLKHESNVSLTSWR